MIRIAILTLLLFSVLVDPGCAKEEPLVGKVEISLRAGWNSIAFFSPPKSTADFPAEVAWLVVPRNGVLLVADVKGGQSPLDTANLLPKEARPHFDGVEALDVSTLASNEGCLIYCEAATEFPLPVPDLESLNLPSLAIDTWKFSGFPVGGIGSTYANPTSGFSPPDEAPLYSLLAATQGREPSIVYLSTAPTPQGKPHDLTKKWKTLKPPSNPNTSWREEWRLRQGEAIWINAKKSLVSPKLAASAIEEVKIELERLHDEEEPPPWEAGLAKSLLLSLGDSLKYIDIKMTVPQGSPPCMYHLREVDWYKADVDWFQRGVDGRPSKDKLQAALRVAGDDYSTMPGDGFVRIDSEQNQPKISFSHDYATVPHLESSHGPWSYSRSIRINTERKTKGVQYNEDPQVRINRILEPGVYLGRFRLVSSASNSHKHPNVVVLIEVPELYGGYEGTLAAQVLSIRGDKPLNPQSFFAQATERVVGSAIPFDDLLSAARPNARSIQIGTFPIRLRVLLRDGTKVATILRDGSFITGSDVPFFVDYNFQSGYSDFHAIDVNLDSAKKTLLLTHSSNCEVSPQLIPILGKPVKDHQPAVDSDDSIPIKRDIQALLQEEASGYLRGVFIERIGKGRDESSDGTFLRRMEKDLATNQVSNIEQAVYVIGEISLFRGTSKEEEERIVKEEEEERIKKEKKRIANMENSQ